MRAPMAACRGSAWDSALRLHASYQQRPVSRVVRARVSRQVPDVLVDLGDLMGVIYRSNRGAHGRSRQYIHWFSLPPRLTSAPDGRQLYVVGGQYRVGRRGIEG